MIDSGPQRNAISLGVFRGEEAARSRLASLQAQGLTNAKLEPRTQSVQQTMLVVRDPTAQAMAKPQGTAGRVPGQRHQDRLVRQAGLNAALPATGRRDDSRGDDGGRHRRSPARCSPNTRAGSKVDLCFQGFEEELRTLPGAYAPPRGRLLLAGRDADAFACIALRPLAQPGGRRNQAAVSCSPRTAARAGAGGSSPRCSPRPARSGYEELKLDTLDWMNAARALYEEAGFRRCPPYYANPLPGVVYMSLRLRDADRRPLTRVDGDTGRISTRANRLPSNSADRRPRGANRRAARHRSHRQGRQLRRAAMEGIRARCGARRPRARRSPTRCRRAGAVPGMR